MLPVHDHAHQPVSKYGDVETTVTFAARANVYICVSVRAQADGECRVRGEIQAVIAATFTQIANREGNSSSTVI